MIETTCPKCHKLQKVESMQLPDFEKFGCMECKAIDELFEYAVNQKVIDEFMYEDSIR